MTFDIVMTATLYSVVLFIWLPRKILSHKYQVKVTKIRIRAHLFAKKYRTVKSLSEKPKPFGEAA